MSRSTYHAVPETAPLLMLLLACIHLPTGIKMVQAIEPAMIEVSKAFKSKVLYCVIDTGLDITNPEFSGEPCSH